MIPKTTMSFFAIVLVLLLAGDTMCEMSEDTVDRINNGIELGGTLLEAAKGLGESKLFKNLGNMASFLGPVGGIISFALLFAPKKDSEELQYMKKKFAEVNGKLDKITSELENVKELITYDTQRAVYVDSADKINHGHRQLLAFLDELQKTRCDNKEDCRRKRIQIGERYVEDFNVKQHLFKIVNGAIKRTSPFGEPLLQLVRKTFKCDVGKVDDLADGILALSFKAQQVILAYEKLKGSNHSITESMNSWLTAVYELREATYKIKKPCFNDISSFMITDIKDKKYQVDVSSNEEANKKVKTFMEKKYKWLGWIAYSFDTTDGSEYCVTTLPESNFWNLPADKNVRKRSLVVSFTDKGGTFSDQKNKVMKALDDIAAARRFSGFAACTVRNEFEKQLKTQGVWKYITSFAVLGKSNGLIIASDNFDTYISKTYRINTIITHYTNLTYPVHLVVVLKSKEKANGLICDKSCHNAGSCERLPYSSTSYCHCKPYFQGTNCENHSQAQLAKTIDTMLQTTLKIPKLSDIAFEIQDLRQYLGVSFGKIMSTFVKLEATFTKAFVDLDHKLTTQFKWANIITTYKDAIEMIQHYSNQFQHLKKNYPTKYHIQEKTIANDVLKTDAIQKWMSDVDYLFRGRVGSAILNHQPLMILFMEKHKSTACSPAYKDAVDNIWRQLVLLQQMGYVIWAQALQIKGWPSGHIGKLYAKRTSEQVAAFDKMTCEYSISNSANVQCVGGRYLYHHMTIVNHCQRNYYTTGLKETTCDKKRSACNPCNCNTANSHGNECSDHSGQCNCKPGYKGAKCNDRDCVWAHWSKYSEATCSKGCDYGGVKTIRRSHQVTKQGNGKRCEGPDSATQSCFKDCCSNQFHCSNRRKCIPSGDKCNYDNNCGDNQDESSCDEHCEDRYTDWAGTDDGDMVYLDRHTVHCGGNGKVLKMFHLERRGGDVRYKYKCCTLNKPICTNEKKYTEFTPDGGHGNAVFLDRQTVSCGDHGYLNEFVIRRNNDHNHIRYEYRCCNLNEWKHRSRTTCKTKETGFTQHDKEGRIFYLDRQTVECEHKYFLTSFHLERNHGGGDQWRYKYTCCKVQP